MENVSEDEMKIVYEEIERYLTRKLYLKSPIFINLWI